MYSSEEGKNFVTNELGFISPFNTFSDEESPDDPLAKEVIADMGDEGSTSVSWNFTAFPSQTFKDDFGTNLLSYTKGEMEWDDVIKATKNEWASEKATEAE